jgi:hypothetical protein
MSNLQKISPEGFDIANAYLEHGDAEKVAEEMQLPVHEVVSVLRQKEVKTYLDGVYLDQGYRNRHKLGALLDKLIEKKLEEAEESEVYTSKDLFELIQFAHKMRIDEMKLEKDLGGSTTVNVAQFGDGNYGKLMERLLTSKKEKE